MKIKHGSLWTTGRRPAWGLARPCILVRGQSTVPGTRRGVCAGAWAFHPSFTLHESLPYLLCLLRHDLVKKLHLSLKPLQLLLDRLPAIRLYLFLGSVIEEWLTFHGRGRCSSFPDGRHPLHPGVCRCPSSSLSGHRAESKE